MGNSEKKQKAGFSLYRDWLPVGTVDNHPDSSTTPPPEGPFRVFSRQQMAFLFLLLGGRGGWGSLGGGRRDLRERPVKQTHRHVQSAALLIQSKAHSAPLGDGHQGPAEESRADNDTPRSIGNRSRDDFLKSILSN